MIVITRFIYTVEKLNFYNLFYGTEHFASTVQGTCYLQFSSSRLQAQ